ncbi:related to Protein OPI10 [Hanseniaspora guilliermondii]|uniref:Related to Protein OPI10 n=1 Tax=Hanseniaspora guilliermondii TaxID=56406 RepID=A0A1L0FHN0_9ASCO|nr:related to Protein OPI10 [Hanseniaspora guilliermondii]
MFAAVSSGQPVTLSEVIPESNGTQHSIIIYPSQPGQDFIKSSYISLFVLPGTVIPEEYVAMVYFKMGNDDPDFKLFGYLSYEKPSAIYKVNLGGNTHPSSLGEIDMDIDEQGGLDLQQGTKNILIGINIEPRAQGLEKLADLKNNSYAMTVSNQNNSFVTPAQLSAKFPQQTQLLAAKIVQHAYNYLTGFLDNQGNVPMKRFDNWWDKFKDRLSKDPKFIDDIAVE